MYNYTVYRGVWWRLGGEPKLPFPSLPSNSLLSPPSPFAIHPISLLRSFKPPFVIFDIRALWPDVQLWASECLDVKNYKWRLNLVSHRSILQVHQPDILAGIAVGWITGGILLLGYLSIVSHSDLLFCSERKCVKQQHSNSYWVSAETRRIARFPCCLTC